MLVPCVSTFIYIKVTQEVNVPFFPVKQCIDLLSFELIAWLLLLWAQSRQATGVTYQFNGSQAPFKFQMSEHIFFCVSHSATAAMISQWFPFPCCFTLVEKCPDPVF